MVGVTYDPSSGARQNVSFDSATSDTTEESKERYTPEPSSFFRTDSLSPHETGLNTSSPGTLVRCFTPKAFASTKDELRRDLRDLQVQLQKSQAEKVKLEQELLEATQMVVISHQQFQESQRQYDQLKMEVETIQNSEDSASREISQVTMLHSQRTVMAQRVLQLLAQNGKLQANCVNLNNQMEQQNAKIQKLEQELYQLRNSEATMMIPNTHPTSRSWKVRSNPASKQRSNQVLQARDAPPTTGRQASLEQRIQELESQNRLLMNQQEQSKHDWDQERNRMELQMTVLKQKALELDNYKKLDGMDSPQKRDFPPFTISCDENDTQDKDQLSFMTNSTCSVTHASRSSWTSPSAYLALQGRVQHMEAQLEEKDAIQVALTQQVVELQQAAQEERQRAELAEERVQSLRAYLNTSWSKHRDSNVSYHEMMLNMSDVDPTRNLNSQEKERSMPSLEAGTLTDESTVSTPLNHQSCASPIPQMEVQTSGESKVASDEVEKLQERSHVIEQKYFALRAKNAELQHRFEQKCRENSELEDLVEQLKARNGDGAETIFALLRHVEKSAESDANQKALRQEVDHLTTEKDDLENRLGATERRLAAAEDRIAELSELNQRLNIEAQSSRALQESLQDKIDAQERELNNHQSSELTHTVEQLQDQNDMLLAEIATLSQKSSDLEDKLALAHEEIDSLRHVLQEKSEDFSSLQSSNERSLEEPQTKQQDSIDEKEDLQEQTASFESAEDIELLRTMTEALETSLKEANEQRRELEVTLATTRMELEIARGKIDAVSNGRATDYVAVSTNPPSIDSRLQLYELEKENHALSRACEEKENQLQEALMQCNQHEQMLETVSVQVLELQLQINELEEGKRELMKQSEAQLDAANAYSTDLERRINKLQCEILSLESERDALHAQVESQKAWLESASSNLRKMEDALQACREELANTKHHGKDLRVEDMVDEPEEEPTFEKEVLDTSLVSENDVSDVELCTSRDGSPNEVVDGENTTPTQGKRTFKEILSFGRKALQLQTFNGKNGSNP